MSWFQPTGANPGLYEEFAASATTVLGDTGRAGDYLESITISAQTTTPGAVTITDGSGTGAITILSIPAGTATSLPYIKTIPVRSYAVNTATTLTNQGWTVTTGAAVSGFATGQFS